MTETFFSLFSFKGGPVFASQTKKLRKRIGMVDQLPCGSVLTPAISCTKFEIHSAHAESPMAETFLSSSDFTEDQSLLHRPRNSRSIQRMQTVPWPKRFFPLQFFGRTGLCFTDQETQEENRHGGPTPFWVSTYTSYLLYKVQDAFSACGQSHGRKIFSSPDFLGRTSLCFTDQETQEENRHGGPSPLWASTYTSYLLYRVQDPFSACRQSHGRNVFFLFSF